MAGKGDVAHGSESIEHAGDVCDVFVLMQRKRRHRNPAGWRVLCRNHPVHRLSIFVIQQLIQLKFFNGGTVPSHESVLPCFAVPRGLKSLIMKKFESNIV